MTMTQSLHPTDTDPDSDNGGRRNASELNARRPTHRTDGYHGNVQVNSGIKFRLDM